jgi:hypothetical protein
MNFTKSSEVDQVCWQLKLADYARGKNRALIDDLFNGKPPFTDEEVRENGIAVNVNFLESTRLAHDARSQFYGAFNKPGNFFKGTTDMGPRHKRTAYSATVTKEINRTMKKSLPYFETLRSQFALDVLHGIGPSVHDDRDSWCPDAVGIEDVLIPSGTLLTMKNLPFFAIYRSYTAPQLIKMTRGAKVDKGWNMKVVNKCLKWIDKESTSLMGSQWSEVWSPEKTAERMKGDSAIYASDAVPTIGAFDFYFWNDDEKYTGWNRRMIVDSWGTPGAGGMSREDPIGTVGSFLFDSGTRCYGSSLNEIINFQFADLSAVAPFRYHSVRSLGFMIYGLCHLQNRMRCKFNEAVFEALLNYLRVKSADDVERALKIELANKGVLEESIQFVPPSERWQVNAQLVELGIQQNQQLITQNSASYVQNQNYSQDRTEKTKFQVMAELNAMTAMVSAALQQAYKYHGVSISEIFRRFMKPNSGDAQVRDTRARILRAGVPEKILVPEAWETEPERIMGAGNKSLEMAISEQLMQYRNLYDPEPQREILRDVTLAITDDPARAEALVPTSPVKVSDAKHDAQIATASILMGLPVDVKTGINHIDYVEALMVNLATLCQKAEKRGGTATEQEIEGMNNLAKHIAQHIQIIAQDPNEKQRVRKYGDELGQLMNLVKGYTQRLVEQMKKAAEQNGQAQMDPKDQAKIMATNAMAQAKVQQGQQSHAAKTAQRQISFEQKLKQDAAKTQAEIKKKMLTTRVDLASKDVSTASEVSRGRIKTKAELAALQEKAAIEAQAARIKARSPSNE